MRDIGKNIKTIRQSKNMTQDALAEALFVTRQTVSNYENGRSRPDLDMLLSIAEVLDTDIHTLIYGPSIPKSKKEEYKRLAISLGMLLLSSIIFFTVNTVFQDNVNLWPADHYIRWINELLMLPTVMFIFGWVLFHILGIFSNLQQLRPKRIRVVKITLLIILGLLIAIPVPYIMHLTVAVVRQLKETNVEMTFPYIPVYEEAFRFLWKLIRHAPFVYILLGGLCWLFGIPKGKSVTQKDTSN